MSDFSLVDYYLVLRFWFRAVCNGTVNSYQEEKRLTRLIGLSMLLMGAAVCAFAGISRVPEIDASSGVAAVTLLSGGLLVLRSRRRKS